uniref:Neural proliferation differentiation and control protein 1 n=2 Tax=Macrostomum lignano TaxID=282301 RepID=A0A1I8G3V9_9PLAT
MVKLILVIILLQIFIACLSTADRIKDSVDKKNLVNFLESSASRGGGDGGAVETDACRIRASCRELNRIVVSCDAETPAVGCGGCKAGFRQSAKSAASQCVPDPSASFGAALDAEKLIDDLAVSSSMNEKDSDSERPQRKGSEGGPTAASSTDSSGGRNDSSHRPTPPPLLPPPRSPPIRRIPLANGDFAFYVIVGAASGLGILLIIFCAVCVYIYTSSGRQAAEKPYINPDYAAQTSGSAGDGKSNSDLQRDMSDDDSDLENDEADFTVYECPGLATTKEMEVRNPLFKEDEDVEAVASASSATGASTEDKR